MMPDEQRCRRALKLVAASQVQVARRRKNCCRQCVARMMFWVAAEDFCCWIVKRDVAALTLELKVTMQRIAAGGEWTAACCKLLKLNATTPAQDQNGRLPSCSAIIVTAIGAVAETVTADPKTARKSSFAVRRCFATDAEPS
jgi:hypothetical protein